MRLSWNIIPARHRGCVNPRLAVAFMSRLRCRHLTKYMYYHTHRRLGENLRPCRMDYGSRSEPGFHQLLAFQEQYMEISGAAATFGSGYQERTHKAQHSEIQQAIRFNLFHIVQASRARKTRRAAKGLTDERMRGIFLGHRDLPAAFLTYTSPRIAKNLLTFATRCCRGTAHTPGNWGIEEPCSRGAQSR